MALERLNFLFEAVLSFELRLIALSDRLQLPLHNLQLVICAEVSRLVSVLLAFQVVTATTLILVLPHEVPLRLQQVVVHVFGVATVFLQGAHLCLVPGLLDPGAVLPSATILILARPGG